MPTSDDKATTPACFKQPIETIRTLLDIFWEGTYKDAKNKEVLEHLILTREELTKKLQLLLDTHIKKGTEPEFATQLLFLFFDVNHTTEGRLFYQPGKKVSEKEIGIALSKAPLGLDYLSTASRLYNQTVNLGQVEKCFDLPYIAEVFKLNRVKNPLADEQHWQQYLYIDQLYDRYQSMMADTTFKLKSLSAEEQLGFIILSLLLDSAVLNKNHLLEVLVKIHTLDEFMYFKNRLFIEVDTQSSNPNKKLFLSKITEALCYQIAPWTLSTKQYFKQPNTTAQKRAISALKMLLKKLELKISLFPKSLQGWTKLVTLYQSRSWSPILLACLSGQHTHHSLSESATARLFPNSASTAPVPFLSKPSKPTVSADLIKIPDSHQFSCIRKIFDMSPSSKKSHAKDIIQIQGQITELTHKLQNNYLLLLQWGESYLGLSHKEVFKRAPKQILKKISAVGRYLLVFADDKFIDKMSAETRIDLFENVIEQALSLKNKNDLQYHLRDFNRWLETSRGVEAIADIEEVFGIPSMTDMQVNANLISFDEYEAIKHNLYQIMKEHPEDKGYRTIYVMLILGFRLGLRVSEAVRLKLSDYIYCPTSPKIIIRPSEDRKIKTANAKRCLNLTHFLSNDEVVFLNELFQFQTELILKSKRKNAYLLAADKQGEAVKSVESIKKVLMKVIRAVCQDNEVMYHHLRHSFASWHFLSAAISELDLEINDYFEHLPKTQEWLAQAQTRKQQHLPTSLKSKKYPYWLAIYIGHGAIDTTLEHYIHTVDMIIMMHQDALEKRTTISHLHGLTGISESMLKRQDNRWRYVISRLIKPHKTLYNLKQSSTTITPFKPLALEDLNLTPKVNPVSNELPYYKYLNYLYLQESSLDARKILGLSKKKELRLIKIFKQNPKFRLKEPSLEEQDLIGSHLVKLAQVYDLSLDKERDIPVALEAIVDTFSSRLYPYFADTESLALQPDYHLVCSDETSGKILVDFLKRVSSPFEIILRYSAQMKATRIIQAQRHWKKALGISRKFKIHKKQDSQTKLGQHGRIEIVITDKLGSQDHAMYLTLVMLSVFIEV